MARGQRSEHDPNRSGTRESFLARMVGYRHTGMDPDEAAIAPERRATLRTPDIIRDSRSLLEQERRG